MSGSDNNEIFGFVEFESKGGVKIYINVNNITSIYFFGETQYDGRCLTNIFTTDGVEHLVVGHCKEIIEEIRRHQKGM